jgi:hypothetical protein
MRSFALGALLILGTANFAHAQLIVGNDQSGTSSIYNVDITTGVATPIYTSTASDSKPWGMAYDGATNTLYWNNGGTLFSSPFGATLTPTNLGSLTFNGSATNYVALAFSNGRLFGTRNIATEAVYEINLTDLTATQLFVYPTAYDFGGLDFDASTGVMYGLTDTAPAPNVRGLYEVDFTAMNVTFRAPYPGGETDIDALAVNNGLAYYVTDGPNTTQPNFYVFNIATGLQVGTLPSPFTGSGTFSAATFIAPIPEPTSLILAGIGGAGLLWRCRRKSRQAS